MRITTVYIRNSFMDFTQEQSLNRYLTKTWQISPLPKKLKSQTKRSHALSLRVSLLIPFELSISRVGTTSDYNTLEFHN